MSQSMWNDEQSQPIQHLRVIDMTVMLTGPFLTRLMAQYGAEVIKIEKLPEGDHLRRPEYQGIFELLNQGKKSFAVNLDKEEGVEIVRKMAAEADVFVENFRDGVMDRLGLGYSDLSEDNPDLIYLSLRGFGGQMTTRSGHDLNFISASGVGEWFLEGGPNYSTQFGDIIGGVLSPLIKLLMHLSNHNRRGMHLISHMDEGFRTLYLPRAYEMVKAEQVPDDLRKNFESWKIFNGQQPHSRYYRCRDNQWVSLQAVQLKHWETFCEVVDRQEWKSRHTDPLLISDLEKLFSDAPASYWEALSGNRDVCLIRVVPWNEFLSFSQIRSQLNSDPLTWAGYLPNTQLLACPSLGKDTLTLGHSVGLNNQQLSKLLAEGVLGQR